jgi:hypothetical protein
MTQATPPADPASTDPGTKPEDDTTGTGTPPEGDPAEDEDEDAEEEETLTPAEVKKLKAKAARREDALRKSQAELRELKAKAEGGKKDEDPEAKANAKLVRAGARTALAGIGVTDRAVQGDVLELINLSDIEVDKNGDPDEDEILERIERLRDALGSKATPPVKRTPARNTSDRGGSNGKGGSDPDSARYQAFLRG